MYVKTLWRWGWCVLLLRFFKWNQRNVPGLGVPVSVPNFRRKGFCETGVWHSCCSTRPLRSCMYLSHLHTHTHVVHSFLYGLLVLFQTSPFSVWLDRVRGRRRRVIELDVAGPWVVPVQGDHVPTPRSGGGRG